MRQADLLEKQLPFAQRHRLENSLATKTISQPINTSAQDFSTRPASLVARPLSDPWTLLVFLVFSMPILMWLWILLVPWLARLFPEPMASDGQTSLTPPEPCGGSVSAILADGVQPLPDQPGPILPCRLVPATSADGVQPARLSAFPG
ncbi:MAG: hypothetical protein NZ602_14070 [Thermoguttaceae bacterium]|nr:hypothetical protein [Thermoguttaceae bacterium]MDW8037623.1 hypothetical protein [Thermoguttaceae bacterium]